MQRLAGSIEGVDVEPGEIVGVAGRPQDRRHAGLGEIQGKDRIAHAVRVAEKLPRLRLLRQVQAVAGDIGVGLIQLREITGVPRRQVLRQVGREADGAVGIALGAADQDHPALCEPAEVHRVAAIGAAHRDGDVLGVGLRRLDVPASQHTQPPAVITRAVTPGIAAVRAER